MKRKLRSKYFPYGTNNWLIIIRALLYSHNKTLVKSSWCCQKVIGNPWKIDGIKNKGHFNENLTKNLQRNFSWNFRKIQERPGLTNFRQIFQISAWKFSAKTVRTNIFQNCKDLVAITIAVEYAFFRSNTALHEPRINQSDCEFQSCYTRNIIKTLNQNVRGDAYGLIHQRKLFP